MGRGTLREAPDWAGDPPEVWMGRRTLPEVPDRSEDSPEGLGWVRGPSQKFQKGRGLSQRSRTGWGTLPNIRDGSLDPPGGPGRVG